MPTPAHGATTKACAGCRCTLPAHLTRMLLPLASAASSWVIPWRWGHAFSSTFTPPSARRFRHFFAGNLGLGWVYEEALQQHSILIVRKRAGDGASDVWPHICDYSCALEAVFPSVKVSCIDGMPLQSMCSQLQTFASASVVILPHGGMLHVTNFARNGASVIALVDRDQVHLTLLFSLLNHESLC